MRQIRPKRSMRLSLVGLCFLVWMPLALAVVWVLQPSVFPDGFAVSDQVVIAYCAALLTFLGGVRLGTLLGSAGDISIFDRFGSAVALFGLAALFLPFSTALAVLIVGFGAVGALDVWSGFRGRLPSSYVDARRVMTWLFCLTLIGLFVQQGLA